VSLPGNIHEGQGKSHAEEMETNLQLTPWAEQGS
jgi:hypothetical protein